MKNIFVFTSIILMLSNGSVSAQFAGRGFISGSARLDFSNYKHSMNPDARGYGYQLAIAKGKFSSDTKAAGWKLSNSLRGGKENYTTYEDNKPLNNERKGLNGFTFGIGRFWQFYKHFNSKFGIYGGPDVNIGFAYTREHSPVGDNSNSYMSVNKSNKIALYGGLSAAVYYRFSEKWWVTAGLAFSDPVSIEYAVHKSAAEHGLIDGSSITSELNYHLAPSFSFPSVNLGLRCFL